MNRHALARAVVAVPERLQHLLLCLLVGTGTTAAFGWLHPWTALPLAAIIAVLTWRWVPTQEATGRRWVWSSIVAVLATIIWMVVQVRWVARFVVASRDPGIYALTGVQLGSTGHSGISVRGAQRLVDAVPGLSSALGAGFVPEADGNVRLQGGNGFPSLLAVGQWDFGLDGVLVVNVLLGGLTLLAVYALARRLVGPAWGLLAPVVLGVSMPFVYFSRGPYTEVLCTGLFAIAIATLMAATRSGKRGEYALAGAFIGAACMVRVDSTLALIGVLGGFAVALIGFGSGRGRALRRGVLCTLAGVWALLLVGLYDFEHNYARYIHDLGWRTTALWVVAALMTVVVLALVGLRALQDRGLLRWSAWIVRDRSDRTLRVWSRVVALATLVAFAGWGTRPLWNHAHHTAGAGKDFITSLQNNAGVAVDGTQSYDELSLNWFAWYFGWPFVVLAVIGLAVMFVVIIRRRRTAELVWLVMTMCVSALYFTRINIFPDQMWGFRRFLPVIAPAFVVAVAWLGRGLWNWRRRPAAATAGSRAGRTWSIPLRIAAAALAVVVVAMPVRDWTASLYRVPDYSNQAGELKSICAGLDGAKDVVLVTSSLDSYALSLRVQCGVQVVQLVADPDDTASTQRTLARLERTAPGTRVVAFDSAIVPWERSVPVAYEHTDIQIWDRTLLTPPLSVLHASRTTWIGEITGTGRVRQ